MISTRRGFLSTVLGLVGVGLAGPKVATAFKGTFKYTELLVGGLGGLVSSNYWARPRNLTEKMLIDCMNDLRKQAESPLYSKYSTISTIRVPDGY